MIAEIVKSGTVTPEAEAWLRAKMSKVSRYKNLEPKITHFTVGYYGRYRMILAWKTGLPKPIPLPQKELSHSLSKKTRVLSNLRKVIDHQVQPLRKPGLHVDHIYPFEAIVSDWLALKGLSWDKVTSKYYADFEAYHAQVAKYQYLTPAENIRKSNNHVSH